MRFHSTVVPARQRGFTLIEVLVVVVILAILAAVVVPRVMDRPGQARQTAAKQGIQSIMTSLNMYRLDNFAYPATAQGLHALVQRPSELGDGANWQGPYLDRVPVDPWQRPYLYLHPGVHGEVDVYTLGADGKPGGEGEAADLGNWDS